MAASSVRDPQTGLTYREQQVVAAWDGETSQTDIAEKLGISVSAISQILRRPHVIVALRTRVNREFLAPLVADRQEREIFWTEVLRDESQKTADRMKAAEYLGKAQGDFIDRVEQTTRVSFEDMLQSLAPERKPEDFDDL